MKCPVCNKEMFNAFQIAKIDEEKPFAAVWDCVGNHFIALFKEDKVVYYVLDGTNEFTLSHETNVPLQWGRIIKLATIIFLQQIKRGFK